jgi:hypothetical protein
MHVSQVNLQREVKCVNIPILSNMVEGLKVFFKTRRYVAYTTVFFATSFLTFFWSILLSGYAGSSYESILINLFVYLGATGTIYFMLGSLFMIIGLEKVWITRRGRGKTTELKGIAWMAVSFAISVFLSIAAGPTALLFFAIFCWIGWIAFQAYLSARTSLRVAEIAEPKKGGIAIGIGSLILLLIGIGIIAAEAIAALVLIPGDLFGIGTAIQSIGLFSNAITNIANQYSWLIVAYAMMGLFVLISLFSFFKYARKGAALNIAILVLFIGIYAGYFLVNVMRRSQPPGFEPVDIFMTLFFLLYAMAGIGRTVTEGVEERRSWTRDLGPLLTFFLASGFFFVDSIIAVAGVSGSQLATWFAWNDFNSLWMYVFRDVVKLIAFPLAAIFSMLYYLRWERVERIYDAAMDDGVIEEGEVDEDVEEYAKRREETRGQIPEHKQGHDLSAPDPSRLRVDSSKRYTPGKRLGDEEEE